LSLHPGDWRITCTLSGYVSQSFGISLSEGGTTSLNFYLQQSDEPNPDPEEIEPATVGGVTIPTNKLEILTPYLALAGLVTAVSTFYVCVPLVSTHTHTHTHTHNNSITARYARRRVIVVTFTVSGLWL